MSDLTPTPVDQWGEATETVELPSGKVAELKTKVNAWALARQGVFSPDHIALFLKADSGELDPEVDDLTKVMELNDLLVRETFVTPKVFVPNGDGNGKPKAGEVHIDVIDDLDVSFVIRRAFGGAADAAQFRGDGDGAGGGGNSEGVGDDPEPAVGAPRGKRGGVGARQKPGGKAAGAGKRPKR